MEYKLEHAALMITLEEKVNESMQEGWEPHGSLLRTPSKWVQPMVRKGYYYVRMEEDKVVERELMG